MIQKIKKEMVGKRYQFIRPLRIGRFKMKVGDTLQIIDIDSGLASYYLVFKCDRLPDWEFRCAYWELLPNIPNIEEIK